MLYRRLLFLCIVVFSLHNQSVFSEEEKHFYYMIVFSNQSKQGNPPSKTHVFATFAEAKGLGADSVKYSLDAKTISWTPAASRPLVRPRPGKNGTLEEALGTSFVPMERVSKWGPFLVPKELYQRASDQIEYLTSGRPKFKALDFRYRGQGASNCIHAVADIDTDHGFLPTGYTRGDGAALAVARHLERWIIDQKPGPLHETHEWVSERIGLGKYPIVNQPLSR